MIAYVGATGKYEFVAALRESSVGRIFQRGRIPNEDTLYPGERWCFDNGAYSDFLNRREFNADQFIEDIARIEKGALRPMFAVCPDLVGSADSLEFSIGWRERLPDWRWYLAVQDGMDLDAVHEVLGDERFAGLFLGGTNEFKARTAHQWCVLAHACGLPAHYGRASVPRKMRLAWRLGYDSFDTSFPLWERRRFWEFIQVVDAHYEEPQEQLDFLE